MIRRPPRSTQSRSSAASDVYKRQVVVSGCPGALSVLSRRPSAEFADAERPEELAAVRVGARQEIGGQLVRSRPAIEPGDPPGVVRQRVDDAAVRPGRDGEVDEDLSLIHI